MIAASPVPVAPTVGASVIPVIALITASFITGATSLIAAGSSVRIAAPVNPIATVIASGVARVSGIDVTAPIQGPGSRSSNRVSRDPVPSARPAAAFARLWRGWRLRCIGGDGGRRRIRAAPAVSLWPSHVVPRVVAPESPISRWPAWRDIGGRFKTSFDARRLGGFGRFDLLHLVTLRQRRRGLRQDHNRQGGRCELHRLSLPCWVAQSDPHPLSERMRKVWVNDA